MNHSEPLNVKSSEHSLVSVNATRDRIPMTPASQLQPDTIAQFPSMSSPIFPGGSAEELRNYVTQLQSQRINDLEKERGLLSATVDKLEKKCGRLTGKVDTLEKERELLPGRMDKLERERAELVKRVKSLEEEREELAAQVDKLEKEGEALRGKVADPDKEREEVTCKVQNLEQEREALAMEVDRLGKALEMENQKVNAWKLEQEKNNRMVVAELKLLLSPQSAPFGETKEEVESLKQKLETVEQALDNALVRTAEDKNLIKKLRAKVVSMEKMEDEVTALKLQLTSNHQRKSESILAIRGVLNQMEVDNSIPISSRVESRPEETSTVNCSMTDESLTADVTFLAETPAMERPTSRISSSSARLSARKKRKQKNLKRKQIPARPLSDRKFKCTNCPLRFAFLYKCNEHMRTVHNLKNVVGTFGCSICGEIFDSQTQFTDHRYDIHGWRLNGITSKLPKVFACLMCPNRYRQLGGWKFHMMNSHKKNMYRYFGCNECGEVFREGKKHLYEHKLEFHSSLVLSSEVKEGYK